MSAAWRSVRPSAVRHRRTLRLGRLPWSRWSEVGELQPLRRRELLIVVVGIGLYVALAIAYSPWWLLGAALVATVPARRSAGRRRLARRVVVLGARDTPMPFDRQV